MGGAHMSLQEIIYKIYSFIYYLSNKHRTVVFNNYSYHSCIFMNGLSQCSIYFFINKINFF